MTKTAFPCCLGVAFFNACLILNVFKISQVWVKTLYPLGLACFLKTLLLLTTMTTTTTTTTQQQLPCLRAFHWDLTILEEIGRLSRPGVTSQYHCLSTYLQLEPLYGMFGTYTIEVLSIPSIQVIQLSSKMALILLDFPRLRS